MDFGLHAGVAVGCAVIRCYTIYMHCQADGCACALFSYCMPFLSTDKDLSCASLNAVHCSLSLPASTRANLTCSSICGRKKLRTNAGCVCAGGRLGDLWGFRWWGYLQDLQLPR